MEREINCPGWRPLAATCPKPVQNPLAAAGTRMHAAYETEEVEGLAMDEKSITQRLLHMTDNCLKDWLMELPGDAKPTEYRERRFWVRNPATLEQIASAQLDRCWVCGDRALILDAKTGYNEVTPSERNWQIRTQALALFHEFPNLGQIRAGIVASRLADKLDVSNYDQNALRAIQSEIIQADWRAKQPDAARHAGTWCDYCPAKAYCREAATYGNLVTYEFQGLDMPALLGRIQQLTPKGLAAIHEKASIIAKILDAVKDRMKGLDTELLASLGYVLKKGATQTKVGNTRMALKLLTEPQGEEPALMTEDQALDFFYPQIPDLAQLVADLNGVNRIKGREMLEQRLAPVITKTPNQPSLGKLKA